MFLFRLSVLLFFSYLIRRRWKPSGSVGTRAKDRSTCEEHNGVGGGGIVKRIEVLRLMVYPSGIYERDCRQSKRVEKRRKSLGKSGGAE